jgi:hypothetical protein
VHGCLSLVIVVRSQVEVSASDLYQGVLQSVACLTSVIAKPRKGRPWPEIGSKRQGGKCH